MKARLVRRDRSLFRGLSGLVTKNTNMELLVELPDGRRVYMTEKELMQFNGEMVYKEAIEKEGVLKALKVFLTSKGTSLFKLCREHEMDHQTVYQQLHRGHIEESLVNELVGKVEAGYRLQKFNNTFMVSKA